MSICDISVVILSRLCQFEIKLFPKVKSLLFICCCKHVLKHEPLVIHPDKTGFSSSVSTLTSFIFCYFFTDCQKVSVATEF